MVKGLVYTNINWFHITTCPFKHRYIASVTGLETYHVRSLRTIYWLSSHPCCAARKDSSYAPGFQSERIGTISAEESSLVLLNGVITLETKGQSEQQAMVIILRSCGDLPIASRMAKFAPGVIC